MEMRCYESEKGKRQKGEEGFKRRDLLFACLVQRINRQMKGNNIVAIYETRTILFIYILKVL
jgi:hypothetical protein